MNNAMGATLGTGSATGTQVTSPYKLMPSYTARCLKPLFRVLCRYVRPKQMPERQMHPLGYAQAEPLPPQLSLLLM